MDTQYLFIGHADRLRVAAPAFGQRFIKGVREANALFRLVRARSVPGRP
ncbi:MAG: hypothetical protein R6V11_07295 [Ectothiorhodospiraceae bacterium]